MTWRSYGALLAVYGNFLCAMLCLWPGLIRGQPQERLARLLRGFCLGNAVIAFALASFDVVAIWALPDVEALAHFRRLWARWGWAALTAWLLMALWHVERWVGFKPVLLGLLALMLVGSTALPSPAPGAVWAHTRSRIYHWPGCRNYPKEAQTQIAGRWTAFPSGEEAERAGYRAAQNCPGESRQR